jgi:hypothetical protein
MMKLPIPHAIGLVLLSAVFLPSVRAELRTYETKYYALHTDLDEAGVKEIIRHITLMAEEFHQRTRGFAGAVNRRLPFYAFRDPEDYYRAGGPLGSLGFFDGYRLAMVVGDELDEKSWHVVQHEAAHQFAMASISRDMPIWVNEGLAEYFGFGEFTGDHFYVGLVPPEKLAQLQTAIREDKLRSLAEMMRLGHRMWNRGDGRLDGPASFQYLQAWSMVHFLAHADNKRYQRPFEKFLGALSRGREAGQAWRQFFGNDVGAFEQRWRNYWLKLKPEDVALRHAETNVATIASFVARAAAERQFFDAFADFTAAAKSGSLRICQDEQWLPPRLLEQALEAAPRHGEWSLRRRGRMAVICERPDGTRIEGRYRLSGRQVKDVDVVVIPPRGGR